MGGNGEAVGEVSIMRSWRSWRFEPLPIRFSPAQVGWFMTPADAFEMRRAQAQGGSSASASAECFSSRRAGESRLDPKSCGSGIYAPSIKHIDGDRQSDLDVVVTIPINVHRMQ